MELTWVEVSGSALCHNLNRFRALTGSSILAPVIKSNAYGHGLIETARVVAPKADWLCVNALYEARALRSAGIDLPIHILGYVQPADAQEVVALGVSLVAYNPEVVVAISDASKAVGGGQSTRLHIKIETGNNRQGLSAPDAVEFARFMSSLPGVEFEGISSHYADIEDSTDHTFARQQLRRFLDAEEALRSAGCKPRIRSFSNSAATILWPETRFELVRLGVSLYGLWPSKETWVSAVLLERGDLDLKPALTWKTVVAQVKSVPAGEYVGYGRTYRTSHASKLAVLPVGYYDGYDRGLSSLAHVLIGGHTAPVRGRIAMNMTVVDVTDIDGVKAGDEVVLLGSSCDQTVSAEQMADWAHTINYEIPTRINDRIPRIIVD